MVFDNWLWIFFLLITCSASLCCVDEVRDSSVIKMFIPRIPFV